MADSKEKTLKVSVPECSLYSTWTCEPVFVGNSVLPSYYKIKSGPSTVSESKSVSYSLPSGAKIKSSVVWLNRGSPLGGVSTFSVNGSSNAQTRSGNQIGFPITLSGTSGTITLIFKFKAAGKIYSDTNTHGGTYQVTNCTLEITYTDGSEEQQPQNNNSGNKKKKFKLPPQSVAIVDQATNTVYYFDGVMKIQHSLSMKLEEEPDENNKAKYVNNAKNEPDKLTLDIAMSDVYTGGGQLTKAAVLTEAQKNAFSLARSKDKAAKHTFELKDHKSRSERAFYKLHEIKEARAKLSVVTPQYIYTDMILSAVTVTQDETHTYGWEGQIVFQHAFEPKARTNNSTPQNTGGTTLGDPQDDSMSSGIFGGNSNNGNGSGSGGNNNGG